MIKYLCRNLKQLRESYELTQETLSSLLGITPQLYCFYETGRRTLSLRVLYALSNLYHLAPYILVQQEILLPERYAFYPVPQMPQPRGISVDFNALYTNLRHNLRALRESHYLSQVALARCLFITPGAYSHYETGRRKPSLEVLCEIAAVYGVTLDELLEEWL